MASLIPNGKQYFVDDNGNPLVGGQVYFYVPNTSTKKNTFQDPGQTILNTNPVILDARGEAIIWGSGSYRQVVYDQFGNLIWDQLTEDANAGLTGNMTDAIFEAGTDFTPGVTTTLTLPAIFGSEDNIWVFFDAAYQGDDQIASLDDAVLTFVEPIPVGVEKVYVKGGTTVAIGTPGDGTITDRKVANGAGIQATKLSYLLDAAGAKRRTGQDKWTDFISVKDFGAKGDGVTDDTTAIQNAIDYIAQTGTSENRSGLLFPLGQYCVTTITFPQPATYNVIFQGAQLVGIATTPTDAIVTWQMEGCTFYSVDVNMNFNTNYTCGIRWYNAEASSQFNSIFGLKIRYGVRGMIYGVNAGDTDTGFAQSENSIYGWRTRGVQNPLMMNHSNGFLNLAAPQLVCGNEEWAGHPSVTFDWATGRAFECINGWLYIEGGEIQKSGSTLGFAADCSNCQISNANIETASPMQLVGPPSAPSPSSGVNLSNCRHLMTSSSISQWSAPAALQSNATLSFDGCQFLRPNGTGAFDRTPMIDVSAATTSPPSVTLRGCWVQEWAFVTTGVNCALVKGTNNYKYEAVQLRQTAADPNVYLVDNTTNNLLENRGIDTLCYSQTGWYNNTDSGSTSISVNPSGPPGYNASSLGLSTTGVARIISANEPGGATTLKQTAFVVRPGELYSCEGWLNYLSGTQYRITARFYNAAGTFISELDVADQGSLPGTNWGKTMGIFAVPSGAYYMAVGTLSNVANGQFTDLRLRRA